MAIELPKPFSPVSSGLGDFAKFLPNLLTTGQAIGQSQSAINAQISGGEIQASAYRSQGANAHAIANYNIKLEKIDVARKVNDLSRNVQRAIGRQRVQAANTGFSSTSKSFLMVMSDTLDGFDTVFTQAKADSEIRENQIRFQASQQAIDSENRARAAGFQAELSAFQIEQQQAKQISGLGTQLTQSITSLLG